MQNHVAKVHQNLYIYKDEDISSQEGQNSRTSESETSSQNSSQNSEDSQRSSKDSQDLDTRAEEVWVGGSKTSAQSEESHPTAARFDVTSPEYPQSHPQPGGSGTGITYSSRESVDPNTSSEELNTSRQEYQQQTPSRESQEYPAMHSSTPYGYTAPLLLGLDKTYHHNFQM